MSNLMMMFAVIFMVVLVPVPLMPQCVVPLTLDLQSGVDKTDQYR